MLKHTLYRIELPSTDLARTMEFYASLFDWTFEPPDGDRVLFETPDGLCGLFRLMQALPGARQPVFVVEVPDYGAFISGAIRMHGGYATFSEHGAREWTVDILDPDGNVMRLGRQTSALCEPSPAPQEPLAVVQPRRAAESGGRIATPPVRIVNGSAAAPPRKNPKNGASH